MIVAIVSFALPRAVTLEQATALFEPGAPFYQSVDGLLRKNYLLSEDGLTAGGVYLWETKTQAEALYTAEWSARMATKFGSAPSVTYFHSPIMVEPSQVSLT
jgi:hypothetical protein